MATRTVQLCQVKKCGKVARFWSKVHNQFVCGSCADPDAVSGGISTVCGQPEVLTAVVAYGGDGWEVT